MNRFCKITLVRIRIDSTDKFKRRPLYEVIVYAARRLGINDAIVLKGMMGYGSNKELYSQKMWEISDNIPLVIELTDTSEKIDEFLSLISNYFEKVNFVGRITVFDGMSIETTPQS